MLPDCDLIDLEDLLGHKGFQWFLGRVRREWGAEAFVSRMTQIQKRTDLDDGTKKDQLNQAIVAREAVLLAMGEIDREITTRRAAARARVEETGEQRT